MGSIQEALERLLANLLRPSQKEIEEYDFQFALWRERLVSVYRSYGVPVNPKLVSSRVTGCYLRNNRDIDVLIEFRCFLPAGVLTELFLEVSRKLAVGAERAVIQERSVFGWPKADIWLNGYVLSMVPMPMVPENALEQLAQETPLTFLASTSGEKLMKLSWAVFFHPEYVLNRLSLKQQDEVRLAKYFFKVAECYKGKVFGRLIELLILQCHSFYNLLNMLIQCRTIGCPPALQLSGPPDFRRCSTTPFFVACPYLPWINLATRLTVEDYNVLRTLASMVLNQPYLLLKLQNRFVAGKAYP